VVKQKVVMIVIVAADMRMMVVMVALVVRLIHRHMQLIAVEVLDPLPQVQAVDEQRLQEGLEHHRCSSLSFFAPSSLLSPL
jgi:hypothetical protein